MSLELLKDVTADTSGVYINSDGYQAALVISGDLDGGTVTIEISIDSGASDLAIRLQDGVAINTFSVTGFFSQFAIPNGVQVKASLAGKTNTNPVSVILY